MDEQDPLVSCLIAISCRDAFGGPESLLAKQIDAKLEELGISRYNSGGGSQNLYGRILAWLDDRKTP